MSLLRPLRACTLTPVTGNCTGRYSTGTTGMYIDLHSTVPIGSATVARYTYIPDLHVLTITTGSTAV